MLLSDESQRRATISNTLTGPFCKFNENKSLLEVLACEASPPDHDLLEDGHIHTVPPTACGRTFGLSRTFAMNRDEETQLPIAGCRSRDI